MSNQQQKQVRKPRSCAGCDFFFAPPPAVEGRDEAAAAAAGMDKGDCVRFPQTVRKRPGDFCGEFEPKEGKSNA